MKKLMMLGVALIAASSVAACSSGPYVLSADEVKNARLSAYDTADRAGMEVFSVMPQDSDRDGYVTATLKGKLDPSRERDVSCPYKVSGQCKPKTGK